MLDFLLFTHFNLGFVTLTRLVEKDHLLEQMSQFVFDGRYDNCLFTFAKWAFKFYMHIWSA